MIDRGIETSYLLSPLSKTTNPENPSQYKLVKDSSSRRVKILLIHNTTPTTLHGNMSTFRDKGKIIELKGELLKMTTSKNYNVVFASLQDKKFFYDFAEEMSFDSRGVGNKSTRDRTLIKYFKSAGLLISASAVSKTIFLSSNPKELCDRLKLLLQQKQARINSDINTQEIIAIVDKLLEYKLQMYV